MMPQIGVEPRFALIRAKSEIAKLTGEIAWYEEEARKSVMLALQYKLEIGRRIARAKALLPHGSFLSWAQQEFGWTPRHVQRHLTLAENASRVSHLPPGTSLRMALSVIRELRSDAGKAPEETGATCESQCVRIVGEIELGNIDRDRLLEEIARLAEQLGAQKMRWKIRDSHTWLNSRRYDSTPSSGKLAG